jgi:hypothetical protein
MTPRNSMPGLLILFPGFLVRHPFVVPIAPGVNRGLAGALAGDAAHGPGIDLDVRIPNVTAETLEQVFSPHTYTWLKPRSVNL